VRFQTLPALCEQSRGFRLYSASQRPSPIIADLFLLAILAIGRQEVHDGTVGADGISPIDIMVFFLTLAYIAISIDASGLIRYLAFKVLQKAGKGGHLLYFYLYTFFFALATFAGNDPIILSGTAFLAYMTRVSSNIEHPRAWIYAQFAVANIGSAILVSSNPTNLVLAGAFGIKFIHYTANMIVPVIVTAIVVFPFLLYIVFPGEELIPRSIKLHELPPDVKNKAPVNPNIPNARGAAEEGETDDPQVNMLSLEEIMNPFLDKKGALFGGVIMAATLITILAVNASRESGQEFHVFWVTLPAAFIMLCWDLAFGWLNKDETREIARKGREAFEIAQAEKPLRSEALEGELKHIQSLDQTATPDDMSIVHVEPIKNKDDMAGGLGIKGVDASAPNAHTSNTASKESLSNDMNEKQHVSDHSQTQTLEATQTMESRPSSGGPDEERAEQKLGTPEPTTLTSIISERHRWLQETFPTVMAVLAHLPLKLVPFAFAMFVLVQALVTKGWVPVFAHGWGHWVDKTGTIGAIGGMGFLGVILCNVSKFKSSIRRFTADDNLVRRHQHRYNHPPLPRGTGLGRHKRAKRHDHFPTHILGNGIFHGNWSELRCLFHGFQRVVGRDVMEGYPLSQTHQGAESGFRSYESADYCRFYGGGVCGSYWRGLYHEVDGCLCSLMMGLSVILSVV
jgi:Na+/H+ antiporter NhaD/arsenite permease-like protein